MLIAIFYKTVSQQFCLISDSRLAKRFVLCLASH